jgi:membrane protein implicated in regulation of membrane protease activity
MSLNKNIRSIILHLIILVCGLISAFFIFYTIRLLYITKGLTVIRVGGGGTYIGAVVFPILAILFAFISWRLYKTTRINQLNNKEESDNA